MKKLLALCCLLFVIFLTACGNKTNDNTSNKKKITDQSSIASLSIHLTNDLLALGITPTGSVVGGKSNGFLPQVASQLSNTKKLGVADDPDMEALLGLNPDAILVDSEYTGQLKKFKEIAPTYTFNLNEGNTRDRLKSVAKIVHKEKEADAFIADYNKEAKEVSTLIKKEINNGKVMAIRVNSKEIRVFSTRRPLGPLLYQDLDLTPADGINKLNTKKAYEVISQEVLPDFHADAIFVIVNSDNGAKAAFKQLESTSIWKNLKAVKEKHVYTLSEQPWLDYSALGNKLSLDEAKAIYSK